MSRSMFIPLSAKIYGISLLMLTLLSIVATGNYLRMTVVKEEVKDVAEYISPINKRVTQIYTYALQQEIAFERMLRLIQESPQNHIEVNKQNEEIQQLSQQIQEHIRDTSALADRAASTSKIQQDVITLARLSPELRMLAEDQQQFTDMYEAVLTAIDEQNTLKSRLLDEQLARAENIFNQRIHRLQTELLQITQASVDKIQEQDEALLTFNLVLSAIAIIIGVALSAMIARQIVKPLKALLRGSDALLAENYQHQIPISSHDEISELTQSFNQLMRTVDKKESLRASMQEYLDPRVVRLLTEHPDQLKGVRQQASVLFSDIAHFSKLSEMLSPEALVAVINEYYNLAGNAILQLDGVVDKYIGDAIVAFWSPPFSEPESIARLACRGALKQLAQLQHLRLSLPDLVGLRKGLPDINIRIGVATGEVVVGNIGTRQSRSFTIIGPPVSVAEQLEQMNKRLGTQILVTESTKQQAGQEFLFRLAGKLDGSDVQFRDSNATFYQLLGYKDAFNAQQIEMFKLSDRAIQAYLNNEQEKARQLLEPFLQHRLDDSVIDFYRRQISD